jgi:protein deglycase
MSALFLCSDRGYNLIMKKRVLCLVADGVEELELVAPVDVLRRAGAEVVLAVVGDGIHVTGRNGMVLHGDMTLGAVAAEEFDLLFIPGGAAVGVLRADGRAAELARAFVAAGKPVAAICAGPLVLEDAGLLQGKRFTAHFSAANELPGAQTGERVMEDGLVMTSRGAGTALEFGLAMVDRLFGEAKEEEIARAIMA